VDHLSSHTAYTPVTSSTLTTVPPRNSTRNHPSHTNTTSSQRLPDHLQEQPATHHFLQILFTMIALLVSLFSTTQTRTLNTPTFSTSLSVNPNLRPREIMTTVHTIINSRSLDLSPPPTLIRLGVFHDIRRIYEPP
jgi:hypothetical protein